MITEQCVKSNLSYHITIITIMGTHIYDVCEKRTTLHKVFFCQFFSLSWPILHFLITPGWFVIVWPFLSLGWFSLWRDRRQIREKGGGRLIARRCWLSPSTRTAAAVVGRKDGTDPRSAASNTAVNLLLFLLNFLYDRVGWHVNCEGVSWLCSTIIKC